MSTAVDGSFESALRALKAGRRVARTDGRGMIIACTRFGVTTLREANVRGRR